MSRINNPLLVAAAALLLAATGCEKVVNLDLKTSDSQLVIEANLANDNKPCQVSLSRSVNYAETNTFPAVSGAAITLADDAGGLETLRESSPGQYVGSTIRGVSGHTYTMRVEVGGAAYVAVSTLPGVPALTGNPAPVPFDVLRTEVSNLGSTGRIQAVVEFTDPLGLGNSYLFRQYRNGRLNKTIFLQNDKFTDGKRVTQALRVPGGGGSSDPNDLDKLVSGDSLVVEMQNVDPNAYEYFRTLNQILQTNPVFSTTPANPKSNFTGGALGYFNAHSRRVRRILVP
jgi:hypothetical protein